MKCAAPVGPFLDTTNGCKHCRKDRFAFETVVRLGIYDGATQQACLRMKQRDALPLGVAMSELLWRRSEHELRRLQADVAVPVPQHWTRKSLRLWSGHNSAEVLARRLASRLGIPFRDDLLWKTRRTPQQHTLTWTQRRSNLRRAFAADFPKKFRDKTVLLVDDVLTTGSTAHETSRALRDAGAGRIAVSVIARGIGQ